MPPNRITSAKENGGTNNYVRITNQEESTESVLKSMPKQIFIDPFSLKIKVVVLTCCLFKLSALAILAVQAMYCRIGELDKLVDFVMRVVTIATDAVRSYDDIKTIVDMMQPPIANTYYLQVLIIAFLGIGAQMMLIFWSLKSGSHTHSLLYLALIADLIITIQCLVIGSILAVHYINMTKYQNGLKFTNTTSHDVIYIKNDSPYVPMDRLVAAFLYTAYYGLTGDQQLARITMAKMHSSLHCCGLWDKHEWLNEYTIHLTSAMRHALAESGLNALGNVTSIGGYTKNWYCDCYKQNGRPCAIPMTCAPMKTLGHCELSQREIALNKTWCQANHTDQHYAFKSIDTWCACQNHAKYYLMKPADNITIEHLIDDSNQICDATTKGNRKRRLAEISSHSVGTEAESSYDHYQHGCISMLISDEIKKVQQIVFATLILVPAIFITSDVIHLVMLCKIHRYNSEKTKPKKKASPPGKLTQRLGLIASGTTHTSTHTQSESTSQEAINDSHESHVILH